MEDPHAIKRGVIIKLLVAYYPHPKAVGDLLVALVKGQAQQMDMRGLAVHLGYLQDKGYVVMERLHSGRANFELQTVRLSARGLDLHDGRIPQDDGVWI